MIFAFREHLYVTVNLDIYIYIYTKKHLAIHWHCIRQWDSSLHGNMLSSSLPGNKLSRRHPTVPPINIGMLRRMSKVSSSVEFPGGQQSQETH